MLEMPNDSVSKSFVPGKGFVPASQLGAGRLRKVVKPGQYKSRGLDKKQRAARDAHEGNTQLFRAIERDSDTLKQRTRTGTLRMNNPGLTNSTGVTGAAWKQGGRAGRKLYAEDSSLDDMPGKTRRFIRNHEEAHVAPKSRTGWRLAQITSQPKKAMREEARADFTAGGTYRNARRDIKRAQPVIQETFMPGMPWQKKVKPKHERAYDRVNTSSHYALAAADEGTRGNIQLGHIMHPPRYAMFGKKPVAGYRDVQDRMAAAQKRRGVQKNLVPTTRGDRAKERTKNIAGSAATTGVSSGLLTAAINARGNRLGPGLQVTGIAGAIGGGIGAFKPTKKRKWEPLSKSMPDSTALHVPGSSFCPPKPKGRLKKRTAGM